MRPPQRFSPDDPREWMNRARSNLTRARNRIAGVYLEDLCFDAQQAAERAIKAVLIQRDVDFPYVHDLVHLLSLLQEVGEPVPEAVLKAGALTTYASIMRYPSIESPVTEEEYLESIGMAEAVIQGAEKRL